jgi:hypothetical protein
VVVTSSNGSLLSSFISLSIPKMNDYLFSYLHTKGIGQSVLKASSQGLISSTVNLQSKPGPLTAKLALVSTANSYIFTNQTATLTFSVSFVGVPLQNVKVAWSTTGGATLNPVKGNTSASGTDSTVFTPAGPGIYSITANANYPQTGPIASNYSLTVYPAPVKPAPSLIQQILAYWYYIAAAAVVAFVALFYVFRLRRKKQRAEIEAGFEVV